MSLKGHEINGVVVVSQKIENAGAVGIIPTFTEYSACISDRYATGPIGHWADRPHGFFTRTSLNRQVAGGRAGSSIVFFYQDQTYLLAPVGVAQKEKYDCCELHKKTKTL